MVYDFELKLPVCKLNILHFICEFEFEFELKIKNNFSCYN